MSNGLHPFAIVTGASSGIGYELAELCAKSGFDRAFPRGIGFERVDEQLAATFERTTAFQQCSHRLGGLLVARVDLFERRQPRPTLLQFAAGVVVASPGLAGESSTRTGRHCGPKTTGMLIAPVTVVTKRVRPDESVPTDPPATAPNE